MSLDTVHWRQKDFDVQQVIKTLSPQVTPRRLELINKITEERTSQFITVLENIYDHGNSSAVIRTAEAFGFFEINHIVVEQKNKDSKRISKGAEKWMVQKKWSDTETCILDLKKRGYQILVTHLEGGRPIHEVDLTKPTALCFGNEKEGASQKLTDLADEKIFIPMKGFVQSFNISVAAAICFFHARTVMEKNNTNRLTDSEKKFLKALYLLRSTKNPELYMRPSAR